MQEKILYSTSKILKDKIERKHHIPYKISKGQRYMKNKRYFSDFWNICYKVIGSEYDSTGALVNAYIKTDDKLYNLICTELDVRDYLLEEDKREIYKSDIVNSKTSYTGAEIVYWFYMNNIDCFNKKYRGFWKFVDNSSVHRLSDYTHYFVLGEPDSLGNYRNCKIARDPSKNNLSYHKRS